MATIPSSGGIDFETAYHAKPMRTRPALTLLTRVYCHLCDDMRVAIAPLAARFGATVTELDVDADAALEERYGERIPVLLLGSPPDGVELCHYALDSGAVHRALAEQAKD